MKAAPLCAPERRYRMSLSKQPIRKYGTLWIPISCFALASSCNTSSLPSADSKYFSTCSRQLFQVTLSIGIDMAFKHPCVEISWQLDAAMLMRPLHANALFKKKEKSTHHCNHLGLNK